MYEIEARQKNLETGVLHEDLNTRRKQTMMARSKSKNCLSNMPCFELHINQSINLLSRTKLLRGRERRECHLAKDRNKMKNES